LTNLVVLGTTSTTPVRLSYVVDDVNLQSVQTTNESEFKKKRRL